MAASLSAHRPSFLQVCDDDTMLEPVNMLKMLRTYNSSVPTYLGRRHHNFALGGAGFVLSRGLLMALVAPWTADLYVYSYDGNGEPHNPMPLAKSHQTLLLGGSGQTYTMLDSCIAR